MLLVTGVTKERHVVGDGGLALVLSWRGADTFICVGQSDAVLIESGMEFPAEVSLMSNGFVRASIELAGETFNLHFKSVSAMLGKFSAYLVDSEGRTVDKALLIQKLHM